MERINNISFSSPVGTPKTIEKLSERDHQMLCVQEKSEEFCAKFALLDADVHQLVSKVHHNEDSISRKRSIDSWEQEEPGFTDVRSFGISLSIFNSKKFLSFKGSIPISNQRQDIRKNQNLTSNNNQFPSYVKTIPTRLRTQQIQEQLKQDSSHHFNKFKQSTEEYETFNLENKQNEKKVDFPSSPANQQYENKKLKVNSIQNEDSTFLPFYPNVSESDLEDSLSNRNDEKKSNEEENHNNKTASQFKSKHQKQFQPREHYPIAKQHLYKGTIGAGFPQLNKDRKIPQFQDKNQRVGKHGEIIVSGNNFNGLKRTNEISDSNEIALPMVKQFQSDSQKQFHKHFHYPELKTVDLNTTLNLPAEKKKQILFPSSLNINNSLESKSKISSSKPSARAGASLNDESDCNSRKKIVIQREHLLIFPNELDFSNGKNGKSKFTPIHSDKVCETKTDWSPTTNQQENSAVRSTSLSPLRMSKRTHEMKVREGKLKNLQKQNNQKNRDLADNSSSLILQNSFLQVKNISPSFNQENTDENINNNENYLPIQQQLSEQNSQSNSKWKDIERIQILQSKGQIIEEDNSPCGIVKEQEKLKPNSFLCIEKQNEEFKKQVETIHIKGQPFPSLAKSTTNNLLSYPQTNDEKILPSHENQSGLQQARQQIQQFEAKTYGIKQINLAIRKTPQKMQSINKDFSDVVQGKGSPLFFKSQVTYSSRESQKERSFELAGKQIESTQGIEIEQEGFCYVRKVKTAFLPYSARIVKGKNKLIAQPVKFQIPQLEVKES